MDMVILSTFFAPPGVSHGLIPRVAEIVRSSSKPVINLTLYGPYTSEILRRFHDAGVVGVSSLKRAVRFARAPVERVRMWKGGGQ